MILSDPMTAHEWQAATVLASARHYSMEAGMLSWWLNRTIRLWDDFRYLG